MTGNVPDDWGAHFVTCERGHRYHASEGGCHQCDLDQERAAERPCKCGHHFEPMEFDGSRYASDDNCDTEREALASLALAMGLNVEMKRLMGTNSDVF